jgi:uncharacterized membrane protein YdjX (TVP38/TMEM64 family)
VIAEIKRAPPLSKYRAAIGLALIAATTAVVVSACLHGVDAATIDQIRLTWRDWQPGHPISAGCGYFLLYLAVAALSIPIATSLTLIAGGLFGVAKGAIIVSFASASGATLAARLPLLPTRLCRTKIRDADGKDR